MVTLLLAINLPNPGGKRLYGWDPQQLMLAVLACRWAAPAQAVVSDLAGRGDARLQALGWASCLRCQRDASVIRRAIDPKEIANPGKMFPGGEAPALSAHGPHPLEKAGIISRE